MLNGRINIGNFDTRFVIQKNTPTVNSTTNERVEGWATVATVWGKEDFRNANELYEADQEILRDVKVFLIRYSSDVSGIDGMHRISEDSGSTYYYVTSVDIARREGFIRIVAERRDG